MHVLLAKALVPCVNGSILGAQVRFGHAPTSGFTRLPSVGGPGGGLPPGPGRNAALDHGLSPGMSPAMGGGASNMEMSRAMAARSTSGLTPSLTPGLSGSLSGLGARQVSDVRFWLTIGTWAAAGEFRCGGYPTHAARSMPRLWTLRPSCARTWVYYSWSLILSLTTNLVAE